MMKIDRSTIADLTEAEIQVLIALIELEDPKETPNNNFYQFHPKSLEQAAKYFRKYRQDWKDAYGALVSKLLICSGSADYRLTQTGRIAANHWRMERPPIWYWYKEFYLEAAFSQAYRDFCERLYGRYLCQQSFSDMVQIDTMVRIAQLCSTNRVLDLGCGNGMLAEYVSDSTGATVHGIDYAPDAIKQALERTVSKRKRLTFEIANLDSLAGESHSYDTILSVDTLYMPRDLHNTLTLASDLLMPEGQILAFYSHFLSETESRDSLIAEQTPLAKVLRDVGFEFRVIDFSRQTFELMQRKRVLAEEMRARFSAEGLRSLCDHLVAESIDPELSNDPKAMRQRRYLYHARKIVSPSESVVAVLCDQT